MPAVEVEHLVVRYGTLVAVDGVSFDADAGEVVALLGPNGAGKTTTVETLEGYRRPDAGAVRVLGLDPWTDHRRLTARIGVVLQRGGIYPIMSAERAVRLFASYYEDPRDPDELLDLVGLRSVAHTPFKRLSGGEQQRLALALALVGRPSVAFLDEPTAGVDPAGRIAVRDVVAGLRGGRRMRDPHEPRARRGATSGGPGGDRRSRQGRRRGASGEIQGGAEELRFAAEPGLAVDELAERLGVPVTEGPPGEYLVAAPPAPALVAALTAWLAERDLALGDLRAGRQRLEDVFLRLTGSAVNAPAGSDSPRRGRRGRSRA